MCGYKGRYPLNTEYLLNGLFYLQFASIVPELSTLNSFGQDWWLIPRNILLMNITIYEIN